MPGTSDDGTRSLHVVTFFAHSPSEKAFRLWRNVRLRSPINPLKKGKGGELSLRLNGSVSLDTTVNDEVD